MSRSTSDDTYEYGASSSGYGLLEPRPTNYPFWIAVVGDSVEMECPPAWVLHAPDGAVIATYALSQDELAELRLHS